MVWVEAKTFLGFTPDACRFLDICEHTKKDSLTLNNDLRSPFLMLLVPADATDSRGAVDPESLVLAVLQLRNDSQVLDPVVCLHAVDVIDLELSDWTNSVDPSKAVCAVEQIKQANIKVASAID